MHFVSLLGLRCGLFIDNLYLFPFSSGFFCQHMHLVVSTRYCKHISHLTPTNFPKWDIFFFWESYILRPPWICFAVLFPHLTCHVFRTTCNHFSHETNIAAPCYISYPVLVLSNSFVFFWSLAVFILELPNNYFAIITTWYQSFWWRLEFACCWLIVCLARTENCWFCGWSPTNPIHSFFVSYKFMLYSPINSVLLWPKDVDFSFCCASSKNQSVFPRCPCDAIDWWLQVLTENAVFPIPVIVTSKNFNVVIITTCCNDTFKLRVGPSHLPSWAIMSVKKTDTILCSIL